MFKLHKWLISYPASPRTSLKLSYMSQPAGAKTGHFAMFFKMSVWFMYVDTASISYLSLGINQLHLISCSAVFYQFYHSFYCIECFSAHFGSLYNAILLLCAHAQSHTRCIQSRLWPCCELTLNYVVLVLTFLSVGTDIIHGLAVHFIILYCTVIAKGCVSVSSHRFVTTPLNYSAVVHFPCMLSNFSYRQKCNTKQV